MVSADPICDFPSPGRIARLRQRLYLVEAIVPAPQPENCTLVRLSCVGDDAQGQQIEVLWEKEVDAELITEEPGKPSRHAVLMINRYLRPTSTVEWRHVNRSQAVSVSVPCGDSLGWLPAGAAPQSLAPAPVDLFIADDVGLGKTIEAGLIARELLLRKKVREIVVSFPPSMLLQWKDELEARFGLVRNPRQGVHETRSPRARFRREPMEDSHAILFPTAYH
jgi:hypothetical protein